MLSKNTIKLIKQLDQKKYRQKNNLFVVEGQKSVKELINSKIEVKEIFALSDFVQQLQDEGYKGSVSEISDKELIKISKQPTPNKVLALAQIPNNEDVILQKTELYIALDRVQDPGNLGTIIRSANWFGVGTIFCSPDTVDVYNSKVVQSAMGSLFNIDVIYADLSDIFSKAQSIDLPIIGTSLSGNDMYHNKLPQSAILLMGNESKGVSSEYDKWVNMQVKIPHYNSNSANVESLNVAVATSILLSEIKRPV